MQLPAVSLSEGGRVVPAKGNAIQQHENENQDDSKLRSKRQVQLRPVPIALTCAIHKKHLMSDPSAEEESILQTSLTVITDSLGRLVSFYKPGGASAVSTATIQVCTWSS